MTKGKKEQAFALFDQGRRPSDPEVKALGVKNKTLYMYFTLSGSSNPSRTEVDEPNNPTRTGTGNLQGLLTDADIGNWSKLKLDKKG